MVTLGVNGILGDRGSLDHQAWLVPWHLTRLWCSAEGASQPGMVGATFISLTNPYKIGMNPFISTTGTTLAPKHEFNNPTTRRNLEKPEAVRR